MRAMVLARPGAPLHLEERPDPEPGPGEVRIAVRACAVCRTDLHVVDGELPDPKLPLIPGHEVVGVVEMTGPGVTGLAPGLKAGVPWLGSTCGRCRYCLAGQENLCDAARFTGYHRDGGYAERIVADARFVFPLPDGFSDAEAAPLLCAGLIGYRAYRMALASAAPGDVSSLGFYGFGAAAHILIQLARFEGRRVHAFSRPGDKAAQEFSLKLGAEWAGGSDEKPPRELDAAIIFAPVGSLVPAALRVVRKGGAVICAGIHMSDIPSFPYATLWGERVVKSVANLTRRDGAEFLELAPRVPIRSSVETWPLGEANRALEEFRAGRVHGAAVLIP